MSAELFIAMCETGLTQEIGVRIKQYGQIAKECNCTKGHAKDEAYELWSILSKALGETKARVLLPKHKEDCLST